MFIERYFQCEGQNRRKFEDFYVKFNRQAVATTITGLPDQGIHYLILNER